MALALGYLHVDLEMCCMGRERPTGNLSGQPGSGRALSATNNQPPAISLQLV